MRPFSSKRIPEFQEESGEILVKSAERITEGLPWVLLHTPDPHIRTHEKNFYHKSEEGQEVKVSYSKRERIGGFGASWLGRLLLKDVENSLFIGIRDFADPNKSIGVYIHSDRLAWAAYGEGENLEMKKKIEMKDAFSINEVLNSIMNARQP